MFDTENSLNSFGADLSGDMVVLSVSQEGATSVPLKMSELQNSTFKATDDGNLLITTQDGEQVVIKDYFTAVDSYITSSDGLDLSSQIINTFSASDTGALTAAIGLASNNNAIAIVDKVEGTAFAVLSNGENIALKNGDKIPELAEIYTRSGSSVDLVLKDGSLLNVGAQARLALDNLNFDPVSESGSMFIVVLRGIFSFASGLIARAEPDNVRLHTPTSEIGLRGTKIIGEVDASGNTKIGLIEGRIVVYKDGLETNMDRPFTMASFFQGGDRSEVQQLNLRSFAEQFDDLSARDIATFSAKGEATANPLPRAQNEVFDASVSDAGAEATTQRFGDIAGEISFDAGREVVIPQNKIPEADADIAQSGRAASAPASTNAASAAASSTGGEKQADNDGTGPGTGPVTGPVTGTGPVTTTPNQDPNPNPNPITPAGTKPAASTGLTASGEEDGNSIRVFENGIGFTDADGHNLHSIKIKLPANLDFGTNSKVGNFATMGSGTNIAPDANNEFTILASDLGNLAFKPAQDYNGAFTIKYQVIDDSGVAGKDTSSEYNLGITVTSVPDEPTVDDIYIEIGGIRGSNNLWPDAFVGAYNDPDGHNMDKITIDSIPNNGLLFYTKDSTNATVSILANGVTLSNKEWESLTFDSNAGGQTPTSAYKASFDFSITNSDGNKTDSQTFEINIPKAGYSINLSDQDAADGYQVVDDDHMIGSNLLSDSDS